MEKSSLRKRDWHSLNIFLKILLSIIGVCLFLTKYAKSEELGQGKIKWVNVYLIEDLRFLIFVIPTYIAILFFLKAEDLVNNRLMAFFVIIFSLMHCCMSAIWVAYIFSEHPLPLGNYLLLTIFPLVTLIYNVQQERRKSYE